MRGSLFFLAIFCHGDWFSLWRRPQTFKAAWGKEARRWWSVSEQQGRAGFQVGSLWLLIPGAIKQMFCGCTGGWVGETCLCHLASLEQVTGHRFSFGFNYFSTAAVNRWKVPLNVLQMQSVVRSASLSVTRCVCKVAWSPISVICLETSLWPVNPRLFLSPSVTLLKRYQWPATVLKGTEQWEEARRKGRFYLWSEGSASGWCPHSPGS